MKARNKLICVGILIMGVLATTVVLLVTDDVDGPIIYQIDVLPRRPHPGDVINIVIYCIDSSGVSGATLHYSVNDGEWQEQTMYFYACLCIAGGRWVGEVGPLDAGENVQFYATAFDNSVTINSADTQKFTVEVVET